MADFLFVCDHGVRGDHSRCDHSIGCSEVDRVALLPWFPDRPGRWAAEGVDEAAIGIWAMEGNRRGFDPWRIVLAAQRRPDPGDPRREAIEIRCLEEHCTTWAFRSDGEKLQTLLTKIATDEKLRTAVTVSADEKLIVMKLQALHLARKTVRARP